MDVGDLRGEGGYCLRVLASKQPFVHPGKEGGEE
jgi:hypothetical protein